MQIEEGVYLALISAVAAGYRVSKSSLVERDFRSTDR
jgi:hypothetical protein